MTTNEDGPPGELGEAGRELWTSVASRYELARHEKVILRSACETADRVASLDAIVRENGVMIVDARGEHKAHPAAIEARLSRLTVARLLSSLRLPDDFGHKPQRRAGFRGTYGTVENGTA